jgi:hypothetical protein
MSDLVGKATGYQKSHALTQEMISKMDERRGWKNVNNEEGTNWKEPQTRLRGNTLRGYEPKSWHFKAQDVMI